MTTSYMSAALVQESISLMFVALGLAIVGFGFARLKTKESFQMHRWIMSGAIILTIASIVLVMVPSLFLYYSAPENDFLSNFSVLQLAHSLLGIPALALSVTFIFNFLPKPTKRWMRITAALWLTTIVLGAVIYYTMPS